MLSELPKLFGKSFAVGFLLPAIAIAATAYLILRSFRIELGVREAFNSKDIVGVAFWTFLVWLFAVALMALNYSIIRFFEGYGCLNPFQLLMPRSKNKFNKLTSTENSLKKAIERERSSGIARNPALTAKRGRLLRHAALDYPDSEEFLLPTRFGNTIRAFEVYSRIIYGLDSIPAWDRLIAVIPKDYREAIDDSKSLMDFWLNLWAGTIFGILLYAGLAINHLEVPRLWIPLLCLAFSCVFPFFARMQAANWGNLIKGAFDLYRSELCEKLGLELPRSIDHERKMWVLVSQIMIYRSKEAADHISRYRKKQCSVDEVWPK